MAGLSHSRERDGVIWVLLGMGLWICVSVPVALFLGTWMRPQGAEKTAERPAISLPPEKVALNPSERDSAGRA